MRGSSVRMPVDLLSDQQIHASVKEVWLALRREGCMTWPVQPSMERLMLLTGRSQPTVAKALDYLTSSGWYVPPTSDNNTPKQRRLGKSVIIPDSLATDRSIGCQAKLLYGTLQTLPKYDPKVRTGESIYTEMSEESHRCTKTMRKAMHELRLKGWIRMEQKNQLQPITYHMTDPVTYRIGHMQARIDNAQFEGEAIAGEWVRLLADVTGIIKGGYPAELENDETGMSLQFDYWIPHLRVAIEFHGPQHFHATDKYDEKTVAAQMHRDHIEARLCKEKGIILIIITIDDLNQEAMTNKLKGCLPLRDLTGYEMDITYLRLRSSEHIENDKAAQWNRKNNRYRKSTAA